MIRNRKKSRRQYNGQNTGATSGAGTAYSSEAHEFNPVFIGGSCYSIFSFQCSVLFFIVCLFVLFILAIVSVEQVDILRY
jgi:hypothetical protein